MKLYFTLLLVLAVHLTGPYLAALVSLGLVIFVGNLFFVKWAMKQMRVEPGEESQAEGTVGASNAIGDTPIRTTVGVPRNRSLRPRDPAAERASAAEETVAPRKDYAGTLASAGPSNEASKGGGRAGFEPLMPFSPGAGVAASANPLPASSRATEPEPAGSLIALAAAPAAPAATAPRGADSLSLPPLSADESKQIESKRPEPSKPVPTVEPSLSGSSPKTAEPATPPTIPASAKSEASADLILVDDKSSKEKAEPQPSSLVTPMPAPTPEVEIPKHAEIRERSQNLPEAAPAPTNVAVSTPPPEAAGGLIPFSLPTLEPSALDMDKDVVMKSEPHHSTPSTPEGALIARPIEPVPTPEPKIVEKTSGLEMSDLVLPDLVPVQEIEPEKKPAAEPESVAKTAEPVPAPSSILPPLESAAPPAVEEPVKPSSRSRVFLPTNLEATVAPELPVAEIVSPAAAVPIEAAPHVPAVASPSAQIVETNEERVEQPVEQQPSAAPQSAVELLPDVSTPLSAHHSAPEPELVIPPVAHPEEERQEALQNIARETVPTGRKPFMPRQAAGVEETSAQAPVTAEAPAATPSPTHPPDRLVAVEPSKAEEEPEAPTLFPVPLDLAEDTGHITAKTPEPELSEHKPVETPDVVAEKPAETLPLVIDDPEVISSREQPEAASETPAEPVRLTLPVTEEAQEAHSGTTVPPVEAAKHEDEQPALPTAFAVSPVDAEHIHGATSEPESAQDDSPHDLPIQLAAAEPIEQHNTPQPQSEELFQPTSEQKEPVREPEYPVEEERVLSEAPEPAPVAPTTEQTPVPLPESLTILPSTAAVAPAEDAPITTPRSYMTSTESTSSQPAAGRASAQLTLGFEVTSLQLTPFFKLGAVQLRPLSNIVSLHLLTAQQAENPLAAGISFQIETVDLDEHAHIRSILLKPLPQAQAAATPQPKLQVDNVQLGQTTEGAPIQVTSSQGTSTAVQLLATCTIAAMDFTPAFEIGSLRLEPNSNFVLLRSAPSQRPAALDLPPSFEVSNVQLEGQAQIASVRLTPSAK